ncbi:MAG: AAA family ATPase [Methylococcaceae bacterium]|nr:AAA family ATPase [Methylococcaceae bacterium]
MYLEHFGLREFPFGLTPNTQFFCALPTHQEAFNVLMIALASGEGFIKITGEVGTGKTMLCRKLLNELGEEYRVAYIPNPAMPQHELLATVAEEIGLPFEQVANTGHLLKLINQHLLDVAGQGKRLVLVLDEAQAIPPDGLELLRLLTNLETESRKLLQIVLFGQPELDQLLDRPNLRQLRQRITFSYRLKLLTFAELRDYVFKRLQVAGYSERDLLSGAAYRLLYGYSRGTPRLINILAHKAMLAAFGRGDRGVTLRHVRAAARDTEGVSSLPLAQLVLVLPALAGVAWLILRLSGSLMP